MLLTILDIVDLYQYISHYNIYKASINPTTVIRLMFELSSSEYFNNAI